MYKVDSVLKERLLAKIQTKANNADPRPYVYVSRPTTPVRSQRFWEKTIIDTTIGSRCSMAIRRPVGNAMGDKVFLAQVVAGDAVIKYATPTPNIKDMQWLTLTTIQDVSELSLMFDGLMKLEEGIVESYTIGDTPYIFYVDTSGSFSFVNLDDPMITGSISDDAVNIASVRGLYSETIGLDDGILVYYTNSIGQLWEAIVLNGEVSELTQITLKPAGVTAWEDIWAGKSWDYRIMLQLKGNDGNVYTLMSVSRPSGFSLSEHLNLDAIKIEGIFGLTAPNFLRVENVGV